MVVKRSKKRKPKVIVPNPLGYAFNPVRDWYTMYDERTLKGYGGDVLPKFNVVVPNSILLPKKTNTATAVELPKQTATTKPTTTTKPTGDNQNYQIGGNKCTGVQLDGTGKCSMDPGGMETKNMFDVSFDVLAETFDPIGYGVKGYEVLSGEAFPLGTKDKSYTVGNIEKGPGYNIQDLLANAEKNLGPLQYTNPYASTVNTAIKPNTTKPNPIVQEPVKTQTTQTYDFSNVKLPPPTNTSATKGESIYKPNPTGTSGSLFGGGAKAPLLPK